MPFIGTAISWLTGKVAGPLFAAVSAVLLIALIVSRISLGSVSHERDMLKAAINDPDTGYIVKVEREKANGVQFKAASDSCNASVKAAKAESDKKLSAAEADLARLRGSLTAANRRAGAILAARPLPMETACQAAGRYLEEANQ